MTHTAAVVLTLLAVVALRGQLPGAEPAARTVESDPHQPGSVVALVVMVAVSLAAIALSLVARARYPHAPHGTGESPRGALDERDPRRWRLALIATAVLLAWLLLVMLLMWWSRTLDAGDEAPPLEDQGPPDTTAPPAPATQTPAPEPAALEPPEPNDSAVFELLLGTTVLVLVLWLAAAMIGRRRRTPEILGEIADDRSGIAVPSTEPDLARAAERGLAEIGDLSRDPRDAIIACYAAMEGELEKSPGTVPQASDTPSEVLARAVARRVLPAGSATELVELFEEARFSPHVMNEEHRADAVRALRAVQRELQEPR